MHILTSSDPSHGNFVMIRDAKKGQRFNSEFQLIPNCDRVDVSSCLRAANFRPEECLDIHNQVRNPHVCFAG